MKMKYNIFEIMLVLSFVFMTVDWFPSMLLGTVLLAIGATYVIRHQDKYMDEYDEEESHQSTRGERHHKNAA